MNPTAFPTHLCVGDTALFSGDPAPFATSVDEPLLVVVNDPPRLGCCFRCDTVPLVAILSDDGTALEAGGCPRCGSTWALSLPLFPSALPPGTTQFSRADFALFFAAGAS